MNDAVLQGLMPAPMPKPSHDERDDIGRLVALTWHGSGTAPSPAGARWLVAVDGSPCALRAVAMVARLVVGTSAPEVDLVHVQPWLNKEAAEHELARRGWAATAEARKLLEAQGIGWHLQTLMGEEASAITSLAETLGSLGIALGSRGLTATESVLLGSVAQKVSHQAKTAVLIVRQRMNCKESGNAAA